MARGVLKGPPLQYIMDGTKRTRLYETDSRCSERRDEGLAQGLRGGHETTCVVHDGGLRGEEDGFVEEENLR